MKSNREFTWTDFQVNKKKSQVLTVLVVCLLVVSCSTIVKYNPPNTKGLTFEQVVEVLNTPEKINVWICGNMSWECGYTSFRKPQDIFETRLGSCIDYANLTGYLLDRAGYEVEVIYAKYVAVAHSGPYTGSGHAVCAYKKDGKWWVVGDSRGRLGGPVQHVYGCSQGPFKTLKDVAKYAVGKNGLRWYNTKWYRTFQKSSEGVVELNWPTD